MNDIVGRISDIRVSNNRLWMKLLEIALQADPDRTKAVLREINTNDKKVSTLVERLMK